MSQSDLETLRSTLLAIDASDVDQPDIPVATVLQEAHEPNALLREERVREAGRYVFRRDPAMTARFGSAYKRRKRRRAAGGGAEPTPNPPVA